MRLRPWPPITVLLGVLALVGCARQGPPAPVLNNNSATAPVAATPVADIVEGGGKIVVRKGQTLYAVARAAGVPLRSLIDANRLQPPYRIHTGETLIVPPIHGHLVQRGETLYRVSRQYGVEAATLVQLNHLVPPYRLKVGEMLTLPPAVVAAGDGRAFEPRCCCRCRHRCACCWNNNCSDCRRGCSNLAVLVTVKLYNNYTAAMLRQESLPLASWP